MRLKCQKCGNVFEGKSTAYARAKYKKKEVPPGMITLKQYAEMHGRNPASCRQMAGRGSFKTAKKIGRDWMIDPSEPYPDRRVKSGKYIKGNSDPNEGA